MRVRATFNKELAEDVAFRRAVGRARSAVT